MVNYAIEDEIIKVITEHQGIKGTELPLYLSKSSLYVDPQTLYDMVAEGKLVEVEYTLPLMPYRIKSFFLPAGSNVVIK